MEESRVSGAREELRLRNLGRELDAAILDAARWKNVCDALAACVDGAGTLLMPVDPNRRDPWMVHSDAVGDRLQSYIAEEWWRRDLRDRAVVIERRQGYATDHDLVNDDTLKRHPYYADFLARDQFGVFVGIDIPAQGGEWFASIQRPLSAGSPSRRVIETLPTIRAMLGGAARASRALASSTFDGWREYFEATDRGFAILSRSGRLGEINAAAQSLLMPFRRARGEIALPDEAAGRRLAELMRRACAPAPLLPLPAPVQFAVAPDRALVFDIVPLPSGLRHFHLDAAAMLVVHLAEALVVDFRSLLIQKFGLTPAEARLAIHISEGLSVREAANAEHITFETARTRLKVVFAKTRVGRQAELVLMIASLTR